MTAAIELTRQQRILRLLGVFGFVFVYALLLWALCSWAFDRVAVRTAFGADRAAKERISVVSVTKPSLVTFSNGARIDVGKAPAHAVLFCFIPGGILYIACGACLMARLFKHSPRQVDRPASPLP